MPHARTAVHHDITRRGVQALFPSGTAAAAAMADAEKNSSLPTVNGTVSPLTATLTAPPPAAASACNRPRSRDATNTATASASSADPPHAASNGAAASAAAGVVRIAVKASAPLPPPPAAAAAASAAAPPPTEVRSLAMITAESGRAEAGKRCTPRDSRR
ncbi:hypothetical protein TSOC_011042 [Tetrabaena socialis]|uniref:Uncharacterized protein n=1 Tax=Tetrabaena socialis TaxID=47790 RepID=A0A2J7ZRN0_9CHLO|nr:hypothetical protein TSOC_011042 [Tetrabaena socialis]|eukprot:PNH02931.1 hypothetical protein TSOC_011042 [Tetrabaena socialis]